MEHFENIWLFLAFDQLNMKKKQTQKSIFQSVHSNQYVDMGAQWQLKPNFPE